MEQQPFSEEDDDDSVASWIEVGSDYAPGARASRESDDEAPGCCCDAIDDFLRANLSTKPTTHRTKKQKQRRLRSRDSSPSPPHRTFVPRFDLPNYSLGAAFFLPSCPVRVHLRRGLSIDGDPIILPDNTSSSIPTHERVLRKAVNRLALKLFPRILVRSEGNVFFSPAGLEVALWALLLGARGRSASDLMRSMGLLHRQRNTLPNSSATSTAKPPAAAAAAAPPPPYSSVSKASPLEQLDKMELAILTLVARLERHGSHCATGLFLNAQHKPLDSYRKALGEYRAYALQELPLDNNLAGGAGTATREADEAVQQFVWAHVCDSPADKANTDEPMQHRPPNANTSLLLVNTAYFRGVCDVFFSPEKTLKLPFYASVPLRWNPPANQAVAAPATSSLAAAASSSSSVLIRTPMMFSRRIGTPFVHVAEHHVALVSLPFRTACCPGAHTDLNHNHKHATRSEALEIVFLLPDSHDGLPALEQSIAKQPAFLWRLLRAVERAARIEVNLWLPRMRIEFGTRLNAVLAELGAASVFSSDADLRGISGGGVHVTDAVQHATFLLDERNCRELHNRPCCLGTSVFASTVGYNVVGAAAPCFRCDHPFLFVVRTIAGRRERRVATATVVGERFKSRY